MKSNQLIIPFFSLIMILSLHIFAQPPGGGRGQMMSPEERAEMQINRMKESLALSEEQYELIYAINLDAALQMKEARASAQGDREAMRETMMALRETTNAQIKEVLDEEQYTKFEELQQNRQRPRKGEGRKGKGKKKTEDDS